MRKGVDYVGVTVVFYCHDGKGNFVMNKRGRSARDEHGRWDPGGGGLEFKDSIEETLRKEVREEYCADVLAHEFLGFRDIHRENRGEKTHWLALDFKVLVDRKEVANGEPQKFDEVRWFSLDDLPPAEEMHSQMPHFIEKYRAKLAG